MIDLLGMNLEQAENLLFSKGIPWKVRETYPTKKIKEDGFLKVIKQEFLDNNYILTVCRVPDVFRQ
ncbi:MAG: PASTA domain-containing protein [Anaerovoracaceae bacterium]|jgi:hypothetical protein